MPETTNASSTELVIPRFWLDLYLANAVNSFEYEVDDKQIENIIRNDSIEIAVGNNSVIDILV